MEPTREELLFGRVVDRRDSTDDWNELNRIAAVDAGAWRRLCELLHDDAMLRAAAAPLLAAADAVAPAAAPRRVVRTAAPWFGWLVAAVLAAAWLVPPAPAPVSGAVVGELPRLLVEAQPISEGRQLRVVSMRRVLEERVVDRAFQFAADELGGLHPTPVDLASLATPTDF